MGGNKAKTVGYRYSLGLHLALVTVAIANKTARTAWAMLVRQENYRASLTA